MAEPNFSKNFSDVKFSNTPADGGSPYEVKEKKDIRYILSVLILVFVLILTGAMYGINFYLDGEIEIKNEIVSQQREIIDIETIKNLNAFDKQVRNLQNLGNIRDGYIPILIEISKLPVSGVRYERATIRVNSDRTYEVEVNAVAESLETYIDQVSVIKSFEGIWGNSLELKNFRIERARGSNDVTFSLVAKVNSVVSNNENI